MKICLIDFNDSFTYILQQTIHKASNNTIHINIFNIKELDLINKITNYHKIILGPGPGNIDEYPVAFEILQQNKQKSILGICLGHQIIAKYAGCQLQNMNKVYHGQKIKITHFDNSILWNNIPKTFYAGLYHSWVVAQTSPNITITAISQQNKIMAIKHKHYNMEGIQFHPESYMTEHGLQIIKNWIYSTAK